MRKEPTLGQRLARNLDLLREARRLDAEAFAAESGVSRQLLSLWRTGNATASLATVERTADRLGVPVTTLLSESLSAVLEGEE